MNDKLKNLFRNILSEIKKSPYTYGFWSIIILLIIPIITWLLYYIGDCGYIIIETSLTVGDALGFYGSFLAFLGTVALGALALWQNKKANDINQILLEIENRKNIPSINICRCSENRYKEADISECLSCEINNSGIIPGDINSDDYFVFEIVNCSNIEISSIAIQGIKSKTLFNENVFLEQKIDTMRINADVLSLPINKSCLLLISGLYYETNEETIKKQYTNGGLELEIDFQIKDYVGELFIQKVKITIFYIGQKIIFPEILKKNLISIKKEKFQK